MRTEEICVYGDMECFDMVVPVFGGGGGGGGAVR